MSRTATSLDALLIGETDVFSGAFGLNVGETIAVDDLTATLAVEWGVDASPSVMLGDDLAINDAIASVSVTGIIAGNVYRLTFTGTTSDGRTLKTQCLFEVRA